MSSLIVLSSSVLADAELDVSHVSSSNTISLADGGKIIPVVVSQNDFECVSVASKMFCDDLNRVTGVETVPLNHYPVRADVVLVAGTVNHSEFIDKLIADKKIDVSKIIGKWENTAWFVVDNPAPGVSKAVVIAGSDRRGTAFGFMRLSEKIGVSPWYWWSDVPVKKADTLSLKITGENIDAPKVKYRGIFINDEDWALHEWAKNNFEKDDGIKRIGPKTNEKIFEFMLRLRMNCFWPAMHEVSIEFCADPRNPILADKYGIVTGSSHCEPMLRNNCHWPKSNGEWNYTTNASKINEYWQESVEQRKNMENIWTLGIRGIHDQGMQGGRNNGEKRVILENIFKKQQEMLDKGISKQYGDIPQCFIPYKEVLPVYDSGLNVPENVTLMWVDDNYGYIRRLSSPEEQKRSGGGGVYYHISYYGGIHSYCEINTTPPALIQYEMLKAYDNNASNIWILNVGDSKPGEVCISYWAELAWNPEAHRGSNDQMEFFRSFAAKEFPASMKDEIAEFLDLYFHLGMLRKPEIMNHFWAVALRDDQASYLTASYQKLLKDAKAIEAKLPEEYRYAWFEMIGFPANLEGNAGLIFMTHRDAVSKGVKLNLNSPEVALYVKAIDDAREHFNHGILNGKWNHFVPDTFRSRNKGNSWSTHMQWPWDEPERSRRLRTQHTTGWHENLKTVSASSAIFENPNASSGIQWKSFNGLGCSATAVALLPVTNAVKFEPEDENAPSLNFKFNSKSKKNTVLIDFLPTYAIYPELKCRVAVLLNGKLVQTVTVPCSESSREGSLEPRGTLCDDNFARVVIPLTGVNVGENSLMIRAVDPGVVVDSVSLPKE